jgi:hypothetical protein
VLQTGGLQSIFTDGVTAKVLVIVGSRLKSYKLTVATGVVSSVTDCGEYTSAYCFALNRVLVSSGSTVSEIELIN